MQKITLLSMLLVLVISYIPNSESSEKFPENVDLPKNNQSLTAQLIENNMPQGEVHLRPKRFIIINNPNPILLAKKALIIKKKGGKKFLIQKAIFGPKLLKKGLLVKPLLIKGAFRLGADPIGTFLGALGGLGIGAAVGAGGLLLGQQLPLPPPGDANNGPPPFNDFLQGLRPPGFF